MTGEAPGREQASSTALVLYGALVGLYVLYSWTWFTWAGFTSDVMAALTQGVGPISSAMQSVVHWLSPAAPLLWCATVWLMHEDSSHATLWRLATGLIVLVPLPVFLG